MKWKALLLVVILPIAAHAGDEGKLDLKTPKDKVSYATGVDMVRSFQRQGVDVDKEIFLKGVKDGLSGGSLLLSGEEFAVALQMFRTEQKMNLAERKRQQFGRLLKEKQPGPSDRTGQ